MDDVWISGCFALAGALVGGLLSPFIGSSIRKRESKRAQLQEAILRIAELEASRNLITEFSGAPRPVGLSGAEMSKFEADVYFKGMTQYFDSLRTARQAIAVVEANGVPVGKSWDGPIEDFINDLGRIRRVIAEELRIKKSD